MELKRRDFLKGLIALAGAGVVGLPELDLALEEAPILQAGDIPKGNYGSLRIDDKWYALYDSVITKSRDDRQTIWVGVNGKRHPLTVFTGEEWQWDIDCELETIEGIDFHLPLHDFEILVHGRTFAGQAYIANSGMNLMIDKGVRYELSLYGVGELKRS